MPPLRADLRSLRNLDGQVRRVLAIKGAAEKAMDILFIAAILGLFALTAGLTYAFEKLRKPS